MEPGQWDRVVELFHVAREKTGGERLALLDSFDGDPSLRVLVEQMLRDDDAPDSFLERLPIEALVSLT